MSKNQRSAIFQATKKPNSVFRLNDPVVRDLSRRDKIEFQFAVPEYRRTHSVSFAFRSPACGGIWRLTKLAKPSTWNSQIFQKTLRTRPAGFHQLGSRALRDEEHSRTNVTVNRLFSRIAIICSQSLASRPAFPSFHRRPARGGTDKLAMSEEPSTLVSQKL
jgi:hypothetical protein